MHVCTEFETIATYTVSKRFKAFPVLKYFLLFLDVTCVIFARATNTDVWQAIIACATTPRKNCSKPP